MCIRDSLLAAQLGGPGSDVRNLVTIVQNPANTPVMSGFEAAVRTALAAGQTVDYSVTPIYRGASLVPAGITIRAIGSGGLELVVTVLNRGG